MANYRDPDMRLRRRIDTRPQNDPYVASGAYALHRDGAGNVIGGKDNYGRPFGTKAAGGGVQTPRLDSNPRQPARFTSAAQIAGEQRDAARAGALRGDFGIGAQQRAENIEGRKSLFRDMQVVGRAGLTDDLRNRARSLGVDDQGWNNATGKLTDAPDISKASPALNYRTPVRPPTFGKPAASAAPANPNALVMGTDGYAHLAGEGVEVRPHTPDQPAVSEGVRRANNAIAKYGVAGASERYLAESARENADLKARKDAAAKSKFQRGWQSATTAPAQKPLATDGMPFQGRNPITGKNSQPQAADFAFSGDPGPAVAEQPARQPLTSGARPLSAAPARIPTFEELTPAAPPVAKPTRVGGSPLGNQLRADPPKRPYLQPTGVRIPGNEPDKDLIAARNRNAQAKQQAEAARQAHNRSVDNWADNNEFLSPGGRRSGFGRVVGALSKRW